MTSDEMIVVARLADHYEDSGVEDALDMAERDFRKFKSTAPRLWRRLYESKKTSRAIGDWLYRFIVKWSQSGMSFRNFVDEWGDAP